MLAALIISLIITVNLIIDPYGEFRLIEGDYNKLKLKAEKTTALQVASKLNDGKYALVFGSSRTMLLSSEIMGEPILNFSTSIYNNPGDILALLKMLSHKQLANVTNIYFLVDINGFHYTKAATEMSSKSRLFLETLRNIGPEKIEDAWNCLVANNKQYGADNFPNNIDSYGTLHKIDKPYHEKSPFFSSHFVTPYYLKSLKAVSTFCADHAIKSTFFTAPWQQPFIRPLQIKADAILSQAAKACGNLLNFQLQQDFTGNTSFFNDPSHLNVHGLKKFIKLLHLSGKNIPQIELSPIKLPTNVLVDYNKITPETLSNIINQKQNISDADSFIQAICETKRKDLIICLYKNIEKLGQRKTAFIASSILYAKPDRIKPLLERGLLHQKLFFKNIP